MSDDRVNSIRARSMRNLQWVDPAQVLISFRQVELNIPNGTEPNVRHLRTNELKHWREARQGLLLAYGLGAKVLGQKVQIAKSEEMDYDCVIRWQTEDRDNFYPVQLKELPPIELNPDITIDDIYDLVEKYNGESDLAVGIHVNREMRLEYHPWNRTIKPRIRELWLFGCLSPDQNHWFIYGNVLHAQPLFHKFDYPEIGWNVA